MAAGSKKQGTALERAVLQQYLAARRGRGSYAASNLLRRGRIPGTDSPDLRSPAKAGAGAHAALEGDFSSPSPQSSANSM